MNNAGVMLAGPIMGADTTEWTRMVETNLLGSMYAVHAALPHLLERKGTILRISSTSGRIASASSGVYAATKSGVTTFSEALRQEVTALGVRVVVVEPGFVATEPTGHIRHSRRTPALREGDLRSSGGGRAPRRGALVAPEGRGADHSCFVALLSSTCTWVIDARASAPAEARGLLMFLA
ncbi:hypothetical protein GCM10009733_082650 [Nonomuraea maheshkhaliensis]|uniref:SDR family NAD(P)-dependent oxidoreductase n=1 Tax=Nonomuraea maheshkhaliensis TaxID=419590 RepID=A0ABP4SHE3_9ACTN